MDIDVSDLIRCFQQEIGQAVGRAVIAEVKLEAALGEIKRLTPPAEPATPVKESE